MYKRDPRILKLRKRNSQERKGSHGALHPHHHHRLPRLQDLLLEVNLGERKQREGHLLFLYHQVHLVHLLFLYHQVHLLLNDLEGNQESPSQDLGGENLINKCPPREDQIPEVLEEIECLHLKDLQEHLVEDIQDLLLEESQDLLLEESQDLLLKETQDTQVKDFPDLRRLEDVPDPLEDTQDLLQDGLDILDHPLDHVREDQDLQGERFVDHGVQSEVASVRMIQTGQPEQNHL